jgi:hypothetical protein
MSRIKQPKVEYGGFLVATAVSAVVLTILPELAFAAPKGPDTLAGLATDIQKDISGSGLSMALNGAGLAAIGYSVFNGFNKGFLVAGALVLAFANIFFPFVAATVAP